MERNAKNLLMDHYPDIHEVLVSFQLKGDSEELVVNDELDNCDHFFFFYTS